MHIIQKIMCLNSWNYTNETGEDTMVDNQIYETAFSNISLQLEGITCYTDVFRNENAATSWPVISSF